MMSLPRWCDEYEIKARYTPALLSVVPACHFLLRLLGRPFWQEFSGNVSWISTVGDLSVSLVCMVALAQFQCALGKHWIEVSVFGKNGERFPTTDMLLFSGGIISREKKEQIRTAVARLTQCTLPGESEELIDPDSARLGAREAVGQVRTIVDKGRATIQYNIRYGFFRNLMGGVIWGVIGSGCCSVSYGVVGNWLATAFFTVWALLHLGLFIFRKPILTKLALAYGDTLFTEFVNYAAKECRHCDIQ